MPEPTAAETERLLAELRALDDAGESAERWEHFGPEDWPVLFRLLDIGADLPRLAGNATVAALPEGLWPRLAEVAGDLVRIQELVDHPAVPAAARLAAPHPAADLERARKELEKHHVTTFEGLFDAAQRARLARCLAELRPSRAGTWAPVERGDSATLVDLVAEGLAGESFRTLTGFDPERGEFLVTLSLQDLEPAGIGWHRDLYWPKEWVGQDVFALFYALGSDSPEKGGAFLSYHFGDNEIRAVYRREHTATVIWNGRRTEDRPFHAVAGYHGDDTSRHLLIAQCLRRSARR